MGGPIYKRAHPNESNTRVNINPLTIVISNVGMNITIHIIYTAIRMNGIATRLLLNLSIIESSHKEISYE